MRHAKAAAEEPGETDFDRVLTAEGIRMARETATTLKGRGFQIERIIASAAARTLQTADIVAEEMQLDAARLDLEELYLAPARAFEAAVCERSFEDESTVVGQDLRRSNFNRCCFRIVRRNMARRPTHEDSCSETGLFDSRW